MVVEENGREKDGDKGGRRKRVGREVRAKGEAVSAFMMAFHFH